LSAEPSAFNFGFAVASIAALSWSGWVKLSTLGIYGRVCRLEWSLGGFKADVITRRAGNIGHSSKAGAWLNPAVDPNYNL